MANAHCVLCGAYKVGAQAMKEHFDTEHAPGNTDYNALSSRGFFDRFGYMPGSATEEFGGEDE